MKGAKMPLKPAIRAAVLLVTGLCMALSFLGCEDEDKLICPGTPSPTALSLVISPSTLILEDSNPTGTFFLATQPKGEADWRVTSKPDWIDVDPSQGTISGQVSQVTVQANMVGFKPGTYAGEIEIISNAAGIGKLTVEVGVGVHPVATASVDSIDFPDSLDHATFILFNSGTGYLQWSLTLSEEWLFASPVSGTIGAGDSVIVNTWVDRRGLAVGDYHGSVTVESNSDEGDVEIHVKMVVPETPFLELSTSALELDYFVDTVGFWIINSGNASFSWNVNTGEAFLQAAPASGSVDAGDSTEIFLIADRTDLPSGVHPVAVTVSNDADQTGEISVTVHHFKDEKWKLDHRVVDAEYDRNNDVIVTVSANPPRLFVLDPEGQTSQSVDLGLAPECVSIRPDGAYAAVGHNGFVSYVNLLTMTVEETYAVTTDAVDIVLASNGWVYVFPRTDQWERIRCIELSTGVESLHTGNSVRAGTLAKLHPSGDYIYAADNGISPSDFEKYDIRSGTAEYMYDSPYHGDYNFAGNIWISDDGLRLFARSGNVFRSSSVKSEDMTYNGNLAGIFAVQWLDHSTVAGRIYVTAAEGWWEPPDPEIRVYEPVYLAFKGTVTLPQFLVPDGEGGGDLYDSEGHFVFVNSTGERFYALLRADEDSGLQLDWAVALFDVASTP
jgi:hypothetical protein